MVSFKIDKQLQTISNYFLFSLAVADLIIGAFSVPLFAVMYIKKSWIFSRFAVAPAVSASDCLIPAGTFVTPGSPLTTWPVTPRCGTSWWSPLTGTSLWPGPSHTGPHEQPWRWPQHWKFLMETYPSERQLFLCLDLCPQFSSNWAIEFWEHISSKNFRTIFNLPCRSQ